MDKRFGDLVYEAWRSGRNPDLVDRDRYADVCAQGFHPDEITLQDIYPQPRTRPLHNERLLGGDACVSCQYDNVEESDL